MMGAVLLSYSTRSEVWKPWLQTSRERGIETAATNHPTHLRSPRRGTPRRGTPRRGICGKTPISNL